MQFYQAPNGSLHQIPPGFEHLLPPGSVPVDDDTANTLLEAQAAQSAVPDSVTMRQARLALLSVGLLADVEAALDALAEPERTSARIEWQYSNEVRREWAVTRHIQQALSLTESQMSALFKHASTL